MTRTKRRKRHRKNAATEAVAVRGTKRALKKVAGEDVPLAGERGRRKKIAERKEDAARKLAAVPQKKRRALKRKSLAEVTEALEEVAEVAALEEEAEPAEATVEEEAAVEARRVGVVVVHLQAQAVSKDMEEGSAVPRLLQRMMTRMTMMTTWASKREQHSNTMKRR